jgi:hypothetical protein
VSQLCPEIGEDPVPVLAGPVAAARSFEVGRRLDPAPRTSRRYR